MALRPAPIAAMFKRHIAVPPRIVCGRLQSPDSGQMAPHLPALGTSGFPGRGARNWRSPIMMPVVIATVIHEVSRRDI